MVKKKTTYRRKTKVASRVIRPKGFDSSFEKDFAKWWVEHGTLPITYHHVIHVSSRWEIDYCFPSYKLAIELQGYGHGHTSYMSMQRDYQKHNDIVSQGWILLYFMSSCLEEKNMLTTLNTIYTLLEARGYDGPKGKRPASSYGIYTGEPKRNIVSIIPTRIKKD
jgi:very-short-patch-repair endonuclease